MFCSFAFLWLWLWFFCGCGFDFLWLWFFCGCGFVFLWLWFCFSVVVVLIFCGCVFDLLWLGLCFCGWGPFRPISVHRRAAWGRGPQARNPRKTTQAQCPTRVCVQRGGPDRRANQRASERAKHPQNPKTPKVCLLKLNDKKRITACNR